MDSRAKLERFITDLAETGDGDMLARSMAAFAPVVLARLPQDPGQLDTLLLQYAGALLALRSDDALAAQLSVGPAQVEAGA